ncbi:MAG: type I-E CRISPR-associated protein Cse1/CasA [Candidatus Magnetominusculus sp. LBB02]|nr:type I-E CRISPR-associated protein Cse1/CasA [Candidatus Magnetominusculus sp. LBB02]
MNNITSNYNLLNEQWIPVLYHDGTTKRVGICDALTEAHKIRQIAAVNPMDRAAILRFLLALLYWCKGNPPDNAAAYRNDSFPSDWFSKLDDNAGCFDLLGKEKRFYQYRKGKPDKSANYLIHEIPTGINFCHFRHTTDKVDGLCPACCAIYGIDTAADVYNVRGARLFPRD